MKKLMAVFSSVIYLAAICSGCQTEMSPIVTSSIPASTTASLPSFRNTSLIKPNSTGNSIFEDDFQTEVIVRTPENFKSEKDVVSFMENAQATHVSVISVLTKEDEDDKVPSGYVFYKSKIAPIANGYKSFDALQSVIKEAHARGIKVKAWIPQFHDRAAIDKDSSWQMMTAVNGKAIPYTGENKEYFVSPLNPDCQKYERSIIREIVTSYDVDSIVLDWIRFDDYPMDVGNYARNEFIKSKKIDPLKIDFSTDNEKRSVWQDWRTSRLADYISDVKNDIKEVKPNVQFGVYVLPLEFVECGQNASKFAGSIDYISPMAYYDDWDYPQNWVYDSCLATANKAVKEKTVIPTFDDDWTPEAYHDIYSHIRTMYPNCKTFSFFEYGKWELSALKRLDRMRGW